MRVFCTYCSSDKNPSEGLLPAIERYTSPRIGLVRAMAKDSDARFCILSGEFGLVDCDQPLPWYNHLLLDEDVQSLAEIVGNQLANKGVSRVDYYTRSPIAHFQLVPYVKVIEEACRLTGVELHCHTLEEDMATRSSTGWNPVTEEAKRARLILVANQERGEEEFRRLLARYPHDGMVVFQRGLGYEAVAKSMWARQDAEAAGHFLLAKADCEKARLLFPMEKWKRIAQDAVDRIARCLEELGHVDAEQAVDGVTAYACERVNSLARIDTELRRFAVTAIEIADSQPAAAAVAMRVCIETIVKYLLRQNGMGPSRGDLKDSIKMLEKRSVVPGIVASHMNTVRIIGNRAAHVADEGEPALRGCDVYPSVFALVAVLGWLDSQS